ncbi:hypothetical protein BBK36DRAFT_1086258, partial [Trichoderma citrinoviride]
CCYPNCSRCLASPECSLIHSGCYAVFRAASGTKNTKALHRRLWLFTAWKRPWTVARPLCLPIRSMHAAVLKQATESLGLPNLFKLPAELLDQIHDNSRGYFFWRCVSALRLALDESGDLDDALEVLRLNSIVSWERHGLLKLARYGTLPPIIRITMDEDGISKVKRLPAIPSYDGEHHKHYAYIVVHEECMTVLYVDAPFNLQPSQNGRLRLQLPRENPTFAIWNTPCPPCMLDGDALGYTRDSFFSASLPWNLSGDHLYAIDMASITGITFFYSHDELLGVHPHCSSGDTASSTFERLSYRLKSQTVWIYLPISKSDPITSLGIIVSERPASILRNPKIEIQICTGTQLTGVTVIGSQHTAPGPVECSWKSAPITLVYAKPQERRGVWLSSYGSNQSALLELPITPVIPKLGGETAYYSEAPLDNVSSAVLFLDEKNIYCRGILFRYLDGSCRALGECRVH